MGLALCKEEPCPSLTLPLRVECRKLVPRFIGPFEVYQIVNQAAVWLKLPAAMKVHPTFHVSRVTPVVESDLSPPADDPPPVQLPLLGVGEGRLGPLFVY